MNILSSIARNFLDVDHPTGYLLRLVLDKKLYDEANYEKAYQNKQMLSYLYIEAALQGIHPLYVNLYQDRPLQFSFVFLMDSIVERVSKRLDNGLYRKYYDNNIILSKKTDLGISNMLSSIRSSYYVVQPVKRLKVLSFSLSFSMFNLSIYNMMKGKFMKSSIFMLSTLELLRISYNCYDQQYSSLFIEQNTFNLQICYRNFTEVLLSSLGIVHVSRNPFHLFHNYILLNLLIDGTILQNQYNSIINLNLKYFN